MLSPNLSFSLIYYLKKGKIMLIKYPPLVFLVYEIIIEDGLILILSNANERQVAITKTYI